MLRTQSGGVLARPVRLACSLLPAILLVLWIVIFATCVPPARADEFEQIEGSALFEIPARPGTRPAGVLTFRDLDALPTVLRDERAALLIVVSDSGNVAKILVSAAFKKAQPDEKGDSTTAPVLIIERFETIDSVDRRSIKARGKSVMLFEGFKFDVDSGHVVPDRMGADLVFSSAGASEPGLQAVGTSRLYTIEKPLPPAQVAVGQPSSGREILTGDFTGRFNLVADGQLSGRLDLSVDGEGTVSGSFRSEKNGTSYPVTGKTGEGTPRRIRFDIKFPRSLQSFDGLIWSEGKNVIAGTVAILDQPCSFVAIREGASLRSTPSTVEPGKTKTEQR